MNVDLKLLALYDKIGGRLDLLEQATKAVERQQGPEGPSGPKGDKGEQGKSGPKGDDGTRGERGPEGERGSDGDAGKDGVSIVDVNIDIDNHLVVTLSDGNQVDAGEIYTPEASAVNYYGSGIGKAEGSANVFIQETQPAVAGDFLWIQTNMNAAGDFTFWFCEE